jgi:hypothetical protein
LMTFQSLLDKQPLLHEPGIRSAHSDFHSYHMIVEYYNYKFACLALMKDVTTHIKIESTLLGEFQEFMKRKFLENKTRVREILVERARTYPEKKHVNIGLYGAIHTHISYDTIMRDYDAVVTSLCI